MFDFVELSWLDEMALGTLGSGTVNKVLTKVQIMSKDVEFSKTKKVAKFVTI